MSGHPPTGSQPLHREEATRSWWLDAESRAAFTEAAEREQQRMARSAVARKIVGYTVGWSVSKARRSL